MKFLEEIDINKVENSWKAIRENLEKRQYIDSKYYTAEISKAIDFSFFELPYDKMMSWYYIYFWEWRANFPETQWNDEKDFLSNNSKEWYNKCAEN